MIHQGVELYGSDRSFLSSLQAIVSLKNNYHVDVVLPGIGVLNSEIEGLVSNVMIRPDGYIRRADFEKTPFTSILNILFEIFNIFILMRKYNIIYINTVVCFSSIIACSFLLFNRKKIVHVREIPTGFSKFLFKYILFISRVELIFNSQATKNAFGLRGSVVLNGVPKFKSTPKPVFHDSHLKLLMIGRINSWKGQDFLLESITKIKKDIKIRIVGSVFSNQQFHLEKLKSISKSNHLDVEFFSFTNDPHSHYLWADYVVIPSKLPEPFGRVAIEGMSTGTPIIAADHGGLVEIISSNVDGFLFVANDQESLNTVILSVPNYSSNEYKRLSSNAYYKYSLKFSEEAYKAALLRVLQLQ